MTGLLLKKGAAQVVLYGMSEKKRLIEHVRV